VKRKADERLMAMVDPAMNVLAYAMSHKVRTKKLKEAVTAARDVLDRALGKPIQRTELTGDEGGPLVIRWGGGA
jgi:hypothetical protein